MPCNVFAFADDIPHLPESSHISQSKWRNPYRQVQYNRYDPLSISLTLPNTPLYPRYPHYSTLSSQASHSSPGPTPNTRQISIFQNISSGVVYRYTYSCKHSPTTFLIIYSRSEVFRRDFKA